MWNFLAHWTRLLLLGRMSFAPKAHTVRSLAWFVWNFREPDVSTVWSVIFFYNKEPLAIGPGFAWVPSQQSQILILAKERNMGFM